MRDDIWLMRRVAMTAVLAAGMVCISAERGWGQMGGYRHGFEKKGPWELVVQAGMKGNLSGKGRV